MTNETGIERVFYIYNSSGCSCLWPYFHPPLLYTELCEVLWVPKLHRFPNKAGLCPGGTSWGLFRSSIGRTQEGEALSTVVLAAHLEAGIRGCVWAVTRRAGTGLGIDAVSAAQTLWDSYTLTPVIAALRWAAPESPTAQTHRRHQANPSLIESLAPQNPKEAKPSNFIQNAPESMVCSLMLAHYRPPVAGRERDSIRYLNAAK